MKKLIKAILINIFNFVGNVCALIFIITMPLYFLLLVQFTFLVLIFGDFLVIVGIQNSKLNVMDYGAVGDGITDDTKAIQHGTACGFAHVAVPDLTSDYIYGQGKLDA